MEPIIENPDKTSLPTAETESANPTGTGLPNKLPLNANDFLMEDRIREATNILKLDKPYSISIITLKETKLNISKSDDSLFTVLINLVVPAGSEYEFDFVTTINFEFWNNAHIRVKLNEIPLDSLFLNDGLSVRGSYEADKSQLYLGFYQN